MPDSTSARSLLREAAALYDDPRSGLAIAANQRAWRTAFASGAAWMAQALAYVRGQPSAAKAASFQRLGFVKYGLACLGSLAFVLGVAAAGAWYLSPGLVLVFYAIEVQMVFLFPLALDGCATPFRESLRWTGRAGGTLPAMAVVMQLAAVMLLGGLIGRGFVRSWCLGCLAVVLWYEHLRNSHGVS